MRQHHPSCSPDTEPCACKALARNDAAWSDDARRHWPSYAAGVRDAEAGTVQTPDPMDYLRKTCGTCKGTGKVYRSSWVDPGDVDVEPCEDCHDSGITYVPGAVDAVPVRCPSCDRLPTEDCGD